jgi:hypothetical protein
MTQADHAALYVLGEEATIERKRKGEPRSVKKLIHFIEEVWMKVKRRGGGERQYR